MSTVSASTPPAHYFSAPPETPRSLSPPSSSVITDTSFSPSSDTPAITPPVSTPFLSTTTAVYPPSPPSLSGTTASTDSSPPETPTSLSPASSSAITDSSDSPTTTLSHPPESTPPSITTFPTSASTPPAHNFSGPPETPTSLSPPSSSVITDASFSPSSDNPATTPPVSTPFLSTTTAAYPPSPPSLSATTASTDSSPPETPTSLSPASSPAITDSSDSPTTTLSYPPESTPPSITTFPTSASNPPAPTFSPSSDTTTAPLPSTLSSAVTATPSLLPLSSTLSASPSSSAAPHISTPDAPCENNGTFLNGSCICHGGSYGDKCEFNSSTTVTSSTTASQLTSPSTTVTLPSALSTSVSTLSSSTASSTASPATLPATTPPWCENSGRYQDGICVCPDEWYGDKCEKAFFCNSSVVNSAGEILTFDAIVVGWFGYSKEQCGIGTPNAGISKASRRCTNTALGPTLDKPIFVSCSRTLDSLAEQIKNNQTDLLEIASNTQIMTSQPEKLTAQEISSAAEIMRVILNASTTAFTEDIAVFAVTTVSQLLNASDPELSSDSVMKNLNSLTKSLEDFSLDQHNISQVVQPNVAVQSLNVTMGSTQGVQFTALTGDTNNLVSNRIILNTNATHLSVNNKTSVDVQIFVNVSAEAKMNGQIGFVLYQNDKFFRSKVYRSTFNISRRVISGSVKRGKINHVDLLFSSRTVPNATLHDHACVFWDYDQEVWSTAGCTKGTDEFGNLRCQCNHTTNFAVLMTFKHDYKYSAPLQWITFIGCGLSIAGLFLTIVIQIITRKSRKATPTLLLVSICSSMLIFNIVFISGINNPNANKTTRSSNTSENILLDSDMHIDRDEGPCTAVTALLHYFLLAIFTWALLYAIQMYILLVDIFRHPPKHFGLIMTAIGWGFPAVVVAVTLGALYRIENPLNYRQEEFCWLAALDSQGRFDIRKPMLWAFLLPVALILLSNMVILVCVILTLCKNNPALKSTKKNSYLKKLLSSLSIAVVLGISWVLGYLMLIDHQQSQKVFSYIFCILNTTQGLQIFFLFVVRTPFFRKKVSDIFYSIPAPEIHLHSKTFILKYKHQGYVGRYKKTDTSFTSVF